MPEQGNADTEIAYDNNLICDTDDSRFAAASHFTA